MKKKIMILALAAAMTAACMAGCGKKAETTTTTDTETATEETANMANPWTETDAAGAAETVGISFDEPDGAQNLVYSVCESIGMVQMSYTDADGNEITARAQATGEAEDISGSYESWSNEQNCTVGTCMGKTMEAQNEEGKQMILCTWYDSVPGISYSLCVTGADLSDLDIASLATVIYDPMQGEADGDSFTSAVGDWVCDYDESTMTITEDGTVAISLTRLASLDGTVNSLEEDLLEFHVTDPSDGEMVLEFNTVSGELKVTDSSWELLENGTTYTFAKGSAESQEAVSETENQ